MPGGIPQGASRKKVHPSQYCTGSGPNWPESIQPVWEGGMMPVPNTPAMMTAPSRAAAAAPMAAEGGAMDRGASSRR